MKWFVVAIVIAIALTFAYCEGRAAADLEAQNAELVATLEDSVPVWLQRTEAAAVAVAETTVVLRTRIVQDNADADSAVASVLERADRIRSAVSDSLQLEIDSLVADVLEADSLRQVAQARADSIADAQAQLLILTAATTTKLETTLADTRAAWQTALRRRRSACGLGGAAGYGVTLSGGVAYAGPSVTIGIDCRIPIRLPFP